MALQRYEDIRELPSFVALDIIASVEAYHQADHFLITGSGQTPIPQSLYLKVYICKAFLVEDYNQTNRFLIWRTSISVLSMDVSPVKRNFNSSGQERRAGGTK
jgi:hypothetical protein